MKLRGREDERTRGRVQLFAESQKRYGEKIEGNNPSTTDILLLVSPLINSLILINRQCQGRP